MDTILYVAIAVAALTVVIGLAAIANAIRVNKRMHSRAARAHGEAA